MRLGLRTLDTVEIVQGLNAGDLVLLGQAPPPGGRVRADTQAVALSRTGGITRDNAGAAISSAIGR